MAGNTASKSTNQRPPVSVIIIFLNAERFIEEAVESVFAQSYSQWDLLLVDDGSTDASTAMARRYAERHPRRVRYLEHPGHENRGMSATRNLGVRHARGEYIAFLDADDVWLPDKLEQRVGLLEAHPEADMLCGASKFWYGWTGRSEDAARDEIVPVGAPQDALIRPPTLLTLLYPLGKGHAPCVSSLLIRRCTIEAADGFEESFVGQYQRYEDQALLSKIYLTSPVFVSSQCYDYYRQHPTSCVAVTSIEPILHKVRYFFLRWLERYMMENGHEGLEAWKALQGALWTYRHPVLSSLKACRRDPGKEARRLMTRLLWATLPAPAFFRLRARFSRDSIMVSEASASTAPRSDRIVSQLDENEGGECPAERARSRYANRVL